MFFFWANKKNVVIVFLLIFWYFRFMKNEKSLVIFDMDGTILNTLQDLADSCNYILQQYQMPLRTVEEIRFFVGNGIPKLIQRAFPKNTDEKLLQNALKDYIEYYEKNACVKTCPYEGIVDLLQTLKQKGFLLAVNTNKVNEAANILCNQFFPNIFDFVLGSSKDFPTKPNPQGVYKILENLNNSLIKTNEVIELKNVIFVGDSDVDIQTGLNAGVTAFGVAWGFRGKDFLLKRGAKKVAKDTQELLEMICLNQNIKGEFKNEE